jgi:hypothetical protein
MRNRIFTGLLLGAAASIASIMFVAGPASAQQLDRIGKKDGVKLTGGLGATASAFATDAPVSYTQPYSYVLSGNLNLDLYGFSIPLFFSYSNAQFSHSGQPLNIIGLSPSYKNLVMHLGYRSMTFSQLTLAGHMFLGAGAEFCHKGFEVAAMGGRLLKAVEADSTKPYMLPSYERWGYGALLGYGANGNSIKAILFYASDKLGSVTETGSFSLYPEENLVYSLAGQKNINDLVTIKAEAAMSAWTPDRRDVSEPAGSDFRKNIFYTDNKLSTRYYQAYSAGADYKIGRSTIGAAYQMVGTGYRTLGAYAVANDFQNITLNGSTNFFDAKLSLSGSIGRQQDDLEKKKDSYMNRTVGSLSANWQLTERLGLNAAYSAFNSVTRYRPVEEIYMPDPIYYQIDTANYIHLSQQLSAGVNYTLLDSDRLNQAVSLNGGRQMADSKQGSDRFGNTLTNAAAGYTISWKETGLRIGIDANGNINQFQNINSIYAGGGANASLPVWDKKLSISLGGNASNNYQAGTRTALLYSAVNSYALSLARVHNFSLSFRYAGRKQYADDAAPEAALLANDFFASIAYRYTFAPKWKKKPDKDENGKI